MRYLMLLAAGLYVAYKMETRLDSKKGLQPQSLAEEEGIVDTTLEDSFPASDPPNFSSYHH